MDIIRIFVPEACEQEASPVGCGGPVPIGYVGESGVRQVVLDFSPWVETYGPGALTLMVRRNGNTDAYPVTLEIDGSTAAWTVSNVDTHTYGVGRAQYMYVVDGENVKSAIFQTFVDKSVTQPGSDPPDPYEGWVQHLTELGAETLTNAQDAAASAEAALAAKTAAETAQASAAGSATAAAGSASDAAAAKTAAETAQASAAGSATAAAENATNAASSASSAASSATAASTAATAASTAATAASNSAVAAAQSASAIGEYEHDAEAWAVGKRGGVDVGTIDETYHNNSKYYSEQAASSAQAASQSAQNAAESATAASQSASGAENSATAASGSASTASTAAATAQGHATNAASSATAASGSATAAANSATAAAASATAAGDAKTAAETAQGKAEDAQEAAEQAQSDAEDAAQSVSQSAAQIETNRQDISDLKSAINELNSISIDDTKTIDPTTTTDRGKVSISSNGNWSSGAHKNSYFYTRPEDCNAVTIIANSTNVAAFAMLKDNTRATGTTPTYATGTTVEALTAGETKTFNLPDDCKILWFYGNNGSTNYLPALVTYGGLVYTDKTLSLSGKAADAKATGDRINEIDFGVGARILESGAGYSLSTDANYYVDKVPSYYIAPEETPTSFAEVNGYLDNKIASIPKDGKHFIFITDTHWDGNIKHSPELISYIRKRTGINKVLFGGDTFGNATNKFLAAKKANGFLLPSKRSAAYDFISCVGDHDNNTVNVTSDETHWLPYAQIEQLFVGDLERHPSYHWYDCREKLADFATVGSDDYNEAVSFFHTVFYVDDYNQKIRFVSLNCGNGGDYGAMYNIYGISGTPLLRLQFDWLVETMMSMQSGWDLVILSHKGNGGNGGVAADIMNSIIYNFRIKNASASGSPSSSTSAIEQWWPHNWSYNFSNAPDVRYIIAINGHEHEDRLMAWGKVNGTYSKDPLYVTSGSTINQPNGASNNDIQIPLIVTSCDSIGVVSANAPSMTSGTVTEQCFDVFTITDTGLVITRIGAGDDRSLTITRNA